ncbi:UDP-sugar pyrophosphorylase-like protein [Tanacetum coccineum]
MASSSAVNSAIERLANLQLNELSTSSSPNLQKNLSILSPNQGVGVGWSSHLFQDWPDPGVDDDYKKALLDQVAVLNSSYPGGLTSYVKTAKELLVDSKAGRNPFDGFTPSLYVGMLVLYLPSFSSPLMWSSWVHALLPEVFLEAVPLSLGRGVTVYIPPPPYLALAGLGTVVVVVLLLSSFWHVGKTSFSTRLNCASRW